jgi:predicted phosphodiesterase
MRIGVASDVHGNLHALETVLTALDQAGCDRVVSPGDLVGYGPRPNECVARLREAGAEAVAGNHDLMAVGLLPVDRLPELQRQTIDWTRAALDDGTRDYLAALPVEARPAADVLMTHGALGDPTVYVHGATAARSQLTFLAGSQPDVRLLLIGHTHHPLAVPAHGEPPPPDGEVELPVAAGRWILNAGSVGQSREARPVARALVIDLDRGSARFLALDYDVAATQRELAEAGLPERACHLPPSTGRRGWLARLRGRGR